MKKKTSPQHYHTPTSKEYSAGNKKIKRDYLNNHQTSDENHQEKQDNVNSYIKDQKTIALLKDRNILKLMPIQYKTFSLLFQGEDIIARDRTGSGKTLAYLLPIILRMKQMRPFKHQGIRYLIILPTRQLCLQVYREFLALKTGAQDFNVLAVYGGSDYKNQIAAIQKGVDAIVSTPGRLQDLLQKNCINLNVLQTICLDQADQMLGLGFVKIIRQIFSYIKKKCNKKIQNLLFSATNPQWLKQISQQFQNQNVKTIDLINKLSNQTSQTVQHYFLKCPSSFDCNKIISQLIKKYGNSSGRTIIFCETKKQVRQLTQSSFPFTFSELHGDLPQQLRLEIMEKFKKGIFKCLIGTNVLARGLDFSNIQLIVQLQPPRLTETYIHRAGRTGRLGKKGINITLYNKKTQFLIQKIVKQANLQFKRIQFFSILNQLQSNRQGKQEFNKSKNNQFKNYQSTVSKIFIGSLPKQFTNQDLKQMLKYKKISFRNAKIFKTIDGKSKQCGLIQLNQNIELNKSISDLQGIQLQGRRIMVKIAHQ